MIFLRPVLSFAIAWLIFIIVGITFATQHVVAQLEDMGAPVALSLQLQMTFSDIIGMLPLYGTIFGIGLVIALTIAWLLVRYGPAFFRNNPSTTFTTAGFVGIAVTLVAMKALFDVTAIATTRTGAGFLLQCLTGALASHVFYQIRRKLSQAA